MNVERAYVFGFHVGLGGTSALALAALLLPSHHPVVLLLMAIWTLASMFVFPWVYVLYCADHIRFPEWFTRGPHQ